MRLVPLALLLAVSPAWAVPPTVLHQARLLDSAGAPITGTHDVALRLYDVSTGGTAAFEQEESLDLVDGYLAVEIGPIPSATLDKPALYVELALDDVVLGTRLPLVSVPYALRAGGVSGPVNATAIDVGGAPFVDASGNVTAGDVIAGDVSAGTVDATRVDVGGTPVITETGEFVGSLLGGALSTDLCEADEALVFDGSAWRCGPAFPGTVSWLDLTDRPVTLSDLACGAGQVPTATGAGWTCAGGTPPTPIVGWLTFDRGSTTEYPLTDFALEWTYPLFAGSSTPHFTLGPLQVEVAVGSDLFPLVTAVFGGAPAEIVLEVPGPAGGRTLLLSSTKGYVDGVVQGGAGESAALTIGLGNLTVSWAGQTASYDRLTGTATTCGDEVTALTFVDTGGRDELPPGTFGVHGWGHDVVRPGGTVGSGGAPGGRPTTSGLSVSGPAPDFLACIVGRATTALPTGTVTVATLDPTGTASAPRYATEVVARCPARFTSVEITPSPRGGVWFDASVESSAFAVTYRTFSPDITSTRFWNYAANSSSDTSCL